jgi:TM2 domain-containing membrane protein YozV
MTEDISPNDKTPENWGYAADRFAAEKAAAEKAALNRATNEVPAMSPTEKNCPFCGELIKKEAVKCKHCGEFLDASLKPASPAQLQYVQAPASVGVAYVLWFFFGTLGVHKFYMGSVGSGLFYLVVGGIGWATIGAGIGAIPLGLVSLLCFIDMFTIPSQIKANYESTLKKSRR